MRLLTAAVSLTLGLLLAFADDKKPEPNNERLDQLARFSLCVRECA